MESGSHDCEVMENLSKDCCLLCRSKKINHLHRLAFGDVFRCLECDYAYTIFAEAELPYEAEVMWGASGWIKTKLYTLSHNRATERKRLKLLQRFVQKGTLLEFGANVGSFLWVANQEGFDVTGSDLHNNLLNVNHIEGMKFYHTDAMECRFEEQFDVITGFQFLEHVDHPLQFLNRLNEFVVPGGFLFFEVPNINSRYHTKHGGNWQHFNEGHFSHFSPESLKYLFERAGYEVLYQDSSHPTDFTVDRYYLPIRHFSWKLLRRVFSRRPQAVKGADARFDHIGTLTLEEELAIQNSIKAKVTQAERLFQKLVAMFVYPYAYYLGRKNQGDIISIIAKKPV